MASLPALVRPALRGGWTCRQCLQIQIQHGSRAIASSPQRKSLANCLRRSHARGFHHQSPALQDQQASQRQALPLGAFYTDLLTTPIPSSSHATSDASLPTFVQSGDETKEERARKLFGNIRGSGYERNVSETPDSTWRTINGVPIPPRPAEPENCCMSGCVHCVWDDYRDDVEQWAARLSEAQNKSPLRATEDGKAELHRPEVHQASGSMDDDGGGSEGLWTAPSAGGGADDLFGGIPVGIREFMATEKKIRERKKAKREKAAGFSEG